jgi:outer membrane receptor protein involved in Fe transport
LKPEKSRTSDVGVAYNSPKTGLKIDLSYFHTYYDNKIVEDKLSTGEYTYINANESKIDGLELMSSFNFGKYIHSSLNLEAYANFTWMLRNNFTQTVNGEVLTRDMQYVRKVNGNFGFNYHGTKINMNLNGRLIGSRLEKDNFSSIRKLITAADYYTKGGYKQTDKVLEHPTYLLFDYSIGYAFTSKINFGIMAANLLDENYTEKDGYNMPGRSIVAKLSYSF